MTESPVVVQVRDVSKRFVIRKEKSLKERLVNFGRSNKHKEDFYALNEVNLDIMAGSTVGLIGPNGSGKSTLLKTIGGIIQPTTGEVKHRGRLAALLELGAGFHPDLTGRENVYLNAAILGLSREETDRHFAEIVEFSGIEPFIDTQVKFYSSGMYVRLAFSVAVHVDPDILIVDEVLAVGDEPFQRKCIERIKAFQKAGKTIIFVSHSLNQVGELCDRAVVLEHGNIMFDGAPSEAIKVLRNDFEAARQDEELDEGVEPSLRIVATEVRLDSESHGRPSSRQSMKIDVSIESSETVEDLLVGIGIETPLGQSVFGTNTELLGVDLPPITSAAVVSFALDGMAFGDGQYVVHASVGSRSGGEVMRDPRAAVFDIETGSKNVGVLGATVKVASLV
ncbi:ABC transporter ATP-binding protein [Diaminobutyricimonas sp. TR449]|uniref:ABC transporter ATP-binding protein n=1 Tax=Diaminobutyricimonas sp. TR449 TaxID=2708076 RepID=UPI00141E5DB7|nr:ABC transporter ATP-binding protein [Diaminobutyricimonas sp. TR449]